MLRLICFNNNMAKISSSQIHKQSSVPITMNPQGTQAKRGMTWETLQCLSDTGKTCRFLRPSTDVADP